MEPDKIQVLRIPASGAPFEVLKVPSVRITNIDNHAHSIQTRNLEDHLKHVPDLRKFKKSIDLKLRCLFDRDDDPEAGRNPWKGDCFIYKCIDSKSKQPKNKYFPDARAYGDAFIFKLNEFTP